MNYLEILEWVQDNIAMISEPAPGRYLVTYIDPDGFSKIQSGESLIEIVLKINEVDLI